MHSGWANTFHIKNSLGVTSKKFLVSMLLESQNKVCRNRYN